jgi:hypothetical protein
MVAKRSRSPHLNCSATNDDEPRLSSWILSWHNFPFSTPESAEHMDSSSSPREATPAKSASATTSRKKEKKNLLSSLSAVTESNLLTRSTIYTSLEAIDRQSGGGTATTTTSVSVKTAAKQRLIDWCQSLSEQFHKNKARLDGKNNGARANRPDETAVNLVTRGLMIGKKDFLNKNNKNNKKRKNNNAVGKDNLQQRHKRRKRIYNRLLSTSTNNTDNRRQRGAAGESTAAPQQDEDAVVVDSTTTPAAVFGTTTAAVADDTAGTRQYVQQLTQCWQQYFQRTKHASALAALATAQDDRTKGATTTTTIGMGGRSGGCCWIGASVTYRGRAAVICGETRTAWCLYRLLDDKEENRTDDDERRKKKRRKSKPLVYVPKTENLQVSLNISGNSSRSCVEKDDDRAVVLRFCIRQLS